jgi:hypothetical protein
MIIDEIATQEEAEAAWAMTQRGVRLVATCHAESLVRLVQNQQLNKLVGGSSQAFLSNEERRLKNKLKKTVLERPYASPFDYVLELRERGVGVLYNNVNKAVDIILDEENDPTKRLIEVSGWVDLAKPLPERLLSPGFKAAGQCDADGAAKSLGDPYGYAPPDSNQNRPKLYHHHEEHRYHQHHRSHRTQKQQQHQGDNRSSQDGQQSIRTKELLAEIDSLL